MPGAVFEVPGLSDKAHGNMYNIIITPCPDPNQTGGRCWPHSIGWAVPRAMLSITQGRATDSFADDRSHSIYHSPQLKPPNALTHRFFVAGAGDAGPYATGANTSVAAADAYLR
jgi:hypothetical protein